MNDISQIEELTLEAEMSVIKALCDCYEKQALILEYSTSEDVSEFSVFQEGFKDVLNEAKGNKNENIVLRILKFIPRLLIGLAKMIKSKWGGKSKIKQLEDDIAALKKMNEEYGDRISSLVAAQTGLEKRINDLDNREELRDRDNKKAQLDNAVKISDLKYDLEDVDKRVDSQNGRLNDLEFDIQHTNELIRKRFRELTKEIDTYHGKVTLNFNLKEYTEAVEERAEFIVRLSKFDFKNDNVRKLGNVNESGVFVMSSPEKSIAGFSYYAKNYIISYDEFVDCVKRLNTALETISKKVKPIIDATNAAIDNLPDSKINIEHVEAASVYRIILYSISDVETTIKNNIASVNKMMNDINETRKIYGRFIK